MTIPQQAVEAATEPRITLRHRGGNGFQGPISAVLETHLAEGWTLEDLDLTAALPALERQIREKVAQEIEAVRPASQPARKGRTTTHYALTFAAQIARGKEQK